MAAHTRRKTSISYKLLHLMKLNLKKGCFPIPSGLPWIQHFDTTNSMFRGASANFQEMSQRTSTTPATTSMQNHISNHETWTNLHWLSTLIQRRPNVTLVPGLLHKTIQYFAPFQIPTLQPRQRYGHMMPYCSSLRIVTLRTVQQPRANTPPASLRTILVHFWGSWTRQVTASSTLFRRHQITSACFSLT